MSWLCNSVQNHLNRTRPLSSHSEIPGFCMFQEAYEKAVEFARDGDNFLEIGSFLGQSTALMATLIRKSGKKINFHAVDPWTDESYDTHEIRVSLTKGSYKHQVERSLSELGLTDYVKLHQMTSEDAYEKFKDDDTKFRWIFIDGLHDYDNVNFDISRWKNMLTEDGIIGGDDYLSPGVTKAVGEHFTNYEISNGNWPFWIKRKSKDFFWNLSEK